MVVALAVATGLSWIARGEYDRIFMLEGRFMIVNASAQERHIGVRFPSGKHFEATIAAGGSRTIEVENTGEGGLQITVDGKARTDKNGHGYVTSMNHPTVVVVGDDHLSVHAIIPRMAPETR